MQTVNILTLYDADSNPRSWTDLSCGSTQDILTVEMDSSMVGRLSRALKQQLSYISQSEVSHEQLEQQSGCGYIGGGGSNDIEPGSPCGPVDTPSDAHWFVVLPQYSFSISLTSVNPAIMEEQHNATHTNFRSIVIRLFFSVRSFK